MKTKLSIIIPAYQVEKYIEDCLDSVFASKRSDFEVVIVDDGSKDRTLEICNNYAKKHDNMKVYTQANAGVSVARNNGIDHASGEYIMFLDSDDMLECGWDEILNGALTKDIYYINSELDTNDKEEVVNKIIGFDRGKRVHLRNGATYIPGPVSKLYKRELLQSNSIYFKKDIIFAEDMLFNIEALKAAKNFDIIKKSIYLYRILSKSTTRVFNQKIYKSYEIFCDEIERIFGKNNKYTIFLKQKSIFNMVLQICMLSRYSDAKKEFINIKKISYYDEVEKNNTMTGFKKLVINMLKRNHYSAIFHIMKPALYLKFSRKNEKIETI